MLREEVQNRCSTWMRMKAVEAANAELRSEVSKMAALHQQVQQLKTTSDAYRNDAVTKEEALYSARVSVRKLKETEVELRAEVKMLQGVESEKDRLAAEVLRLSGVENELGSLKTMHHRQAAISRNLLKERDQHAKDLAETSSDLHAVSQRSLRQQLDSGLQSQAHENRLIGRAIRWMVHRHVSDSHPVSAAV